MGALATTFETAFLHRRAVAEDDIDFMGHVNNLVYLRWAAEMAERHWQRGVESSAGVIGGAFQSAQGALHALFGAAVAEVAADMQAAGLWIVLRHEIDYHRELKLGDEVELRTWVDPVKGVRCPRHVDIRKAGSDKASAKVLTIWTFIDTQTRRPKRLPPDMKALFGM